MNLIEVGEVALGDLAEGNDLLQGGSSVTIAKLFFFDSKIYFKYARKLGKTLYKIVSIKKMPFLNLALITPLLFVPIQARSQDRFGERVRDPQKVDLLDPKSGLFEPHSLTLLQKPHFWPILWLKVGLLADLGVHRNPSTPILATGLWGPYPFRSYVWWGWICLHFRILLTLIRQHS